VDINLMGVVHGVEIFTPLIESHGEGGHLINVASMAGHVANAGMSPYFATKFAVVGYSEAIKMEFAEAGGAIGVSVLCPAWVNTNIHHSGKDRPSGAAENPEQIAAMDMVIRSGLPADAVGEWTADCVEANRFYISPIRSLPGH
jgi:short-subunit dehydrogenase